MKIAVCGSMVFTEKMLEVKKELEGFGHTVFVSVFVDAYKGKTEKEKESLTLFHKNEKDAIREFWKKIKQSDAILVLNYDRRGVKNYIGGNTLMEIGFAHVLKRIISTVSSPLICPTSPAKRQAFPAGSSFFPYV